MTRLFNNDCLLALSCALLGGAVGFFVGKDAGRDGAAIRGLQNEIAKLQLELNQTKGSKPSILRPTPGIVPTPTVESPSALTAELRAQKQSESHKRDLEKRVARTAAERDGEYTHLFSELGVGAENVERFKSNLVELHRKAITAGEPLQELVLARDAYDKEVRSVLGEENYARYRTYEAYKPAVREYKLLEEYALNEQKFALEPAYKDQILYLIKEAGATTTETWHDPYDPLPRPAAGAESIERLRANYASLIERSNLLLESASRSELPDNYRQLLRVYYIKQIEQAQRSLAYWDRPIEQIIQEKEMEIRAKASGQPFDPR